MSPKLGFTHYLKPIEIKKMFNKKKSNQKPI